MPCVSGRAEMSSVRDAAMCGHSGVNAIFCTLFNGYDGIHTAYSAYLDPSPRSDLHRSTLGYLHQYVQTVRFLGN